MSKTGLTRLQTVRALNSNPEWINRGVYRLMYCKELYIAAYEKIKSKAGNMTPANDKETLDGFNIKTISNIIERMKDESFQFRRARRVKIPKADGIRTRSLNIAPPTDKLVQQVMLFILEAIYDVPKKSLFKDSSFGFRQGLGCHDALASIRNYWGGSKWFIEGDISNCFDEIDHQILTNLLRKKINDERFINLIWKSLKAGYMEFKIPSNSIIGSPQGSILSPMLANVYLHELDVFVEKLNIEIGGDDAKRTKNPVYRSIQYKIKRLKLKIGEIVEEKERKLVIEEKKKLANQLRTIPSFVPNDENFQQIKYVRYADDFLIAVYGSKTLAEKVRNKVQSFLKDHLQLRLNLDKTHIRHAKTEHALFLGTMICIGKQVKVKSIISKGKKFKRRISGHAINLHAPLDKVEKRLKDRGFLNSDGSPKENPSYSILDAVQIIKYYNSVIRGLDNYYSFVHNKKGLSYIGFKMVMSCAKTLATKYKISKKKVFARFGSNLTIKYGKGKSVSIFKISGTMQLNSFKRGGRENVIIPYLGMNNMRTLSKLDFPCVICGENKNIEMHHVRHVRKIGQKVKGFNRVLASINRKQIPVCRNCHNKIHKGEYDGIALRNFKHPSLAGL